jgi:hypothetical protein
VHRRNACTSCMGKRPSTGSEPARGAMHKQAGKVQGELMVNACRGSRHKDQAANQRIGGKVHGGAIDGAKLRAQWLVHDKLHRRERFINDLEHFTRRLQERKGSCGDRRKAIRDHDKHCGWPVRFLLRYWFRFC